MEPKILIIGRNQKVINILIDELKQFGRDIVGTNSKETVKEFVESNIDIVIMGAGLSDQVREEMTDFILSIRPDLPVHLIERTGQSSPAKMIPFVNEKVVEFKIEKEIGKRPNTIG